MRKAATAIAQGVPCRSGSASRRWAAAPTILRRFGTSPSTETKEKEGDAPQLPAQVPTRPQSTKVQRTLSLRGVSDASFRRVIEIARPEKYLIAFSVASLFVTSSVSLVLPLGLGQILDLSLQQAGISSSNVLKAASTSNLSAYLPDLSFASSMTPMSVTAALLGLFAIQSGMVITRMSFLSIAGERIVARIRKQLFASVLAQELVFFDTNRTGDLLSRLSSDSQQVQRAITNNLSNGTRSLIMASGGAVAMLVTAPQLSLVSLLVIPPIAIGGRVLGRYLKRKQLEVQDALAQASANADLAISGIRTVRQNVAEKAELERYSSRIHRAYSKAVDAAIASAWFDGTVMFALQGSVIAVLGYGGTLVASNQLTVGALSSFIVYSMYVGFNIASLANVYGELMKAAGASNRIFAIMDKVPLIDPGWDCQNPLSPIVQRSSKKFIIANIAESLVGSEPPLYVRNRARYGSVDVVPMDNFVGRRLLGHVKLNNVHFSYPQRPNEKILQGINLNVRAGTSVAIVGQSGSGKSTILSLISRMYDPDEGEVIIDDTNIKNMPPQWLRSQIGVVQQDPVLLGATIADNLRYAKPDATLEEMESAADAAGALGFIRGLSHQWDTEVGERGTRLSGGQRQRIAIARALMMDAPIILMDESSSSLDAETEYHMLNAVEKMSKDGNRTLISVAHRLSTTKRAGTVIVLDKGQVVETGSHDDLLRHGTGIYRELIKRQL